MKTEIKVTELTHEELVDILSTSLYDSSWFKASYDRSVYESLENKQGECFEDILADMLLSGHNITIIDIEADGEKYSDKFIRFEEEYLSAVYEVSLEDFLTAASTPEGYKMVYDILEGCGDAITGDCFLQRVVFGEEIYG